MNLNFWFREILRVFAECLGLLPIPCYIWILLVLADGVLKWFRGLVLPVK